MRGLLQGPWLLGSQQGCTFQGLPTPAAGLGLETRVSSEKGSRPAARWKARWARDRVHLNSVPHWALPTAGTRGAVLPGTDTSAPRQTQPRREKAVAIYGSDQALLNLRTGHLDSAQTPSL